MLYDGLAAAALLLFLAFGARRGALASGLSLLGLAAAYAAAAAAALRLGPRAAEAAGLALPLGAALAGTAAFAAVSLLFAGVGVVARRLEARRRGDTPRALGDRLGGALFGAVRGALVVLLVGVLALWSDAARELRGASEPPPVTPLRTATAAAVEAGVAAALGEEGPGATVAARAAAHPAATLGALRDLVEHPRIDALVRDPGFWDEVEAGRIDFALARPSFRDVARDAALRQQLAEMGLVDPTLAADPALFRREMRSVLTAVGPRLRTLRDDPDLARLAHDPQLLALLEQGDVLGLLRHPGLQRVVGRALAAPAG